MFNQQVQGNYYPHVGDYPQRTASVPDVGVNGEKKGVQYSEYQNFQPVVQQPAAYPVMQGAYDEYVRSQQGFPVYSYSIQYPNNMINNKVPPAYFSQPKPEKALNGKTVGVPMAEMNVGAMSFYPAYTQVIPGYNSMISPMQYTNANFIYPQQNGMPYQMAPLSIKREAPVYGINDKNNKKQQTDVKVSYPHFNAPQQRSVAIQPAKSAQEIGTERMGEKFNEVECAVASILCGMKTPSISHSSGVLTHPMQVQQDQSRAVQNSESSQIVQTVQAPQSPQFAPTAQQPAPLARPEIPKPPEELITRFLPVVPERRVVEKRETPPIPTVSADFFVKKLSYMRTGKEDVPAQKKEESKEEAEPIIPPKEENEENVPLISTPSLAKKESE